MNKGNIYIFIDAIEILTYGINFMMIVLIIMTIHQLVFCAS